MIPWWAGLLMFFAGAFIGIFILALITLEEPEEHKYIRKGK